MYTRARQVVTEHIYGLLESEGGLHRLPVPGFPAGPGFIFASQDWDTCDQLMILIHGSGVVRAGQWARRWVFNVHKYVYLYLMNCEVILHIEKCRVK